MIVHGWGHHWLYLTASTDQDAMKQFAKTVQHFSFGIAAAKETDRLAGFLRIFQIL